MDTHRIEATLEQDGTLVMKDLPFQAGDSVEVLVVARQEPPSEGRSYPLRGTPVEFSDPFEPVATDEWDAAS